MAKILKNTTIGQIDINDTGISIAASPGEYTIPQQDYLLWAASSDIITYIGNGSLVVNDGSFDLSISNGTDLIKGLFPTEIIVNQGTIPWEVSDSDNLDVLNAIAAALNASTSVSILKNNEVSVTSRTEFTLSGTTYTVPSGKNFLLSSFVGSYDSQAALHLRLKKQTGGVGSFNTVFKMTMMSGGQGDSTLSMNFGNGINIGLAGDVFKLTVEASIAKGTVFGSFSGSEI